MLLFACWKRGVHIEKNFAEVLSLQIVTSHSDCLRSSLNTLNFAIFVFTISVNKFWFAWSLWGRRETLP